MFESVPYAAEWLQPWAMEPMAFQALADFVRRVDLPAHLARVEANPVTPRKSSIEHRIAIVPLIGTLMKATPSLMEGTSTVGARRQIRAAVADDQVGGILFLIDSPGGTVAGTEQLAADIAWARARKHTIAYVEDCCCSAAIWAAAQAGKIIAGPSAIVGSIGTFGVVVDSSQAAADRGLRVHVITTSPLKGAGVAGAEITTKQLAEMQRRIESLNDLFVAGIAAGRNIPMQRARELADGRVWVGQQAVNAGLIDAVGSFEDALQIMAGAIPAAYTAPTKQIVAKAYTPATLSPRSWHR